MPTLNYSVKNINWTSKQIPIIHTKFSQHNKKKYALNTTLQPNNITKRRTLNTNIWHAKS